MPKSKKCKFAASFGGVLQKALDIPRAFHAPGVIFTQQSPGALFHLMILPARFGLGGCAFNSITL
jgi:hypothetical protein